MILFVKGAIQEAHSSIEGSRRDPWKKYKHKALIRLSCQFGGNMIERTQFDGANGMEEAQDFRFKQWRNSWICVKSSTK